jgi:deoxyribodipyrimidine photo-lyase
MQVVWFKRDLRITDHAPLTEAARSGAGACNPCLHEDALLSGPDADARHLGFLNEALDDLDTSLNTLGLRLLRLRGTVPYVFDALRREQRIDALWSHEETGNFASFQRDRAVAAWCRANGVVWHERPNGAVVRRLRDRDEWSARWMDTMRRSPLPAPSRVTPASHFTAFRRVSRRPQRTRSRLERHSVAPARKSCRCAARAG